MTNFLQDKEILKELFSPTVSKNKTQMFLAKCTQCSKVALHPVRSKEYTILCTSFVKKTAYVCSKECEIMYNRENTTLYDNKSLPSLLENMPSFDDDDDK